MGFFDSIKNALGGKDKSEEGIKGPSLVLKEAGIDPSDMDFSFSTDGTVTITGQVSDQATLEKVGKIVGDIPQISGVNNKLAISEPEVAEPEPEPDPTPETTAEPASPATETPEAAAAPEAAPTPGSAEPETAETDAEPMETYTVQPGDSLWKIAEAHYGSGNRYHAIFDANRDILDNPDLIKPGQVLKLPAA